MVREQHYRILDLVLQDPETYLPAFGTLRTGMDPTEVRRDILAQLIVLHFENAYVGGLFGEDVLRSPEGMPEVLANEYGWRYWHRFRNSWLRSSNVSAMTK
jgi:hypothetical protein